MSTVAVQTDPSSTILIRVENAAKKPAVPFQELQTSEKIARIARSVFLLLGIALFVASTFPGAAPLLYPLGLLSLFAAVAISQYTGEGEYEFSIGPIKVKI